jgi:hypothetical protein
MRHYVEQNQNLGPQNIKHMVLGSKWLIWFQMKMLMIMPHMPGKDRVIAKIIEPIHKAATAITLKSY